jgi:hypothetical protein
MTPHLITQRFTTLSIFNIKNCARQKGDMKGRVRKIVKCYPSIKHVQQCVMNIKCLNLKGTSLLMMFTCTKLSQNEYFMGVFAISFERVLW